MGFNLVYQSLKELFPQVDARILKAVAIEHSKDPDGAVKSIYSEVLPFISKHSDIHSTTVENTVKNVLSTATSSSTPLPIAGKDANAYDNPNHELKLTLSVSKLHEGTDDHFITKNRNENKVQLRQHQEVGTEADEGKKSDASSVRSAGKCSEDNFSRPFRNYSSRDHEANVNPNNDQTDHLHHFDGYSSYCNFEESRVSNEEASVSVEGHALHSGFTEKSPMLDEVGEDSAVLSTILTSSGQICEINLLQDIVEDAKHYKVALLSAIENVTTMMKEVEHKEKEAQDAKEAAAKGGSEILEKMGELKEMLKHAKEANDMHAGEVYGEKSILATEARELQARLLGLSDEKDKSLSILEQMQETLQARLATAEKEKSAAEEELLQKEENARAALAKQELIMEKVVQESKVLKQEAEENAKLHDFLMEKGRFLDVLQGEISVICQDVKLLKENFDSRVSISNSLPLRYNQRSSNSSLKSMASDVASGPAQSSSRISQATLADCETPRSTIYERSIEAAVGKELLDDDWEVFDFSN